MTCNTCIASKELNSKYVTKFLRCIVNYIGLTSLHIFLNFFFGMLSNYNCPAVCTNGAVRLVGGASSNKGKLEYCHYGAWSSVCYYFHDEEATVACKQLGFSGSPSKNIPV